MSKFHSLLLVFFTGISVTAIEIAAARLVAPFFGSTVYVWGGSIGTALFALALGYWLGGTLVDKYPSKKILGFVLLFSGTTTAIIPWLYSPFFSTIQLWTTSSNIPVAIAVMASMLSLFLWPLIGMGMVSPIVLRLSIRDVKTAGSWSGLLSGTSTVGSIIGTFVSAFATIPLIGTRATILGASVLLVLLAAPYFRLWPILTILLGIGATGYMAQASPLVNRPGLLWSQESVYQLIQVAADEKKRYLYYDTASGAQSVYVPGSVYSTTLYDAFGLLPYLSNNGTKERSVLVVGLAGATSVRPYSGVLGEEFNFSITGVEIDPETIWAAKKYFDIDSLGIKIVNDDARFFLSTSKERYDIIIVDAYTNELVIPPTLATKEFYQQLATHLQPGGVVGFNVAALPASRYYPKLVQTMAAVFPDVRHGSFSAGSLNNLVIAGQAIDFRLLSNDVPAPVARFLEQTIPRMVKAVPGGPVYTDDRTDLDIRVRPFVD